MDEKRKGFHILSDASYASAILPAAEYDEEIMFGYYPEDGGTEGECAMRWYSNRGIRAARLEIYDDAFILFNETDLFLKLSKDCKDITKDQFINLLKECGFVDLTSRKIVDITTKKRFGENA